MSPFADWIVTTGLVSASGEIIHCPIDPLIVEFIHAFPNRVEVRTIEDRRLVASGAIDDSGTFVAVEWSGDSAAGSSVLVLVDLLGVDEEALA